MQWIPGHCVYKPGLATQLPNCPIGYAWRKGHYRRKPSVEATHKYMNRFEKKMKHEISRHPVLCQGFENLGEFKNCLRLIRQSMQSFLLKNPTRTEIKKYSDHLVASVILCAGRRLQNQCFFQPTTKVKRYIEKQIAKYID